MGTDARKWAQAFREATNSDETIRAMGKYYTCSFLLDMGEARVIVRMHDGKVDDIDLSPGILDPYDFSIRASAETWRKFAVPAPEPMFHGIWAASFREDMKLEGNLTAMFQNLRNFTVQLELLRETGVPV
ncbi:MAG: hypothetical protein JWP87_3795 [Labilithrix sp.]|nr:hypothetical protein [Labilithrix sp.]